MYKIHLYIREQTIHSTLWPVGLAINEQDEVAKNRMSFCIITWITQTHSPRADVAAIWVQDVSLHFRHSKRITDAGLIFLMCQHATAEIWYGILVSTSSHLPDNDFPSNLASDLPHI